MTVDGIPNVRVCTDRPEGAVVTGQNFVGSLDRDLMRPPTSSAACSLRPASTTRRSSGRAACGRSTRRSFVTPPVSASWTEHGARPERVEVEHRHVDTVVIGGGQAGLEAAIAGGERGESVVVVDEGPEPGGSLLADYRASRTAGALQRALARVPSCSLPRSQSGCSNRTWSPSRPATRS